MALNELISIGVGAFGILAFIGSFLIWIRKEGKDKGKMCEKVEKLAIICKDNSKDISDAVQRIEEQEKESAIQHTEIKGVNVGILRIETSLESMRNETTKVLLSIQKQTR